LGFSIVVVVVVIIIIIITVFAAVVVLWILIFHLVLVLLHKSKNARRRGILFLAFFNLNFQTYLVLLCLSKLKTLKLNAMLLNRS